MGIVDFVLRRPSAYNLRKKYDKLREKADRMRDINRRIEVLRMLDRVEPLIVSLEEHHMSDFEKRRTASFANSSMNKLIEMLKEAKKDALPKEVGYR